MRFAISLFLICLTSAAAVSQPLVESIYSLEAQALNSRYICVGRILSLDNQAHVNAIVEVELGIKGEQYQGKMGLMVKASGTQLEKWRDTGARLLILEESVIDLGDPKLQMMTAEALVLRKPEDIIAGMKLVTRENRGIYRIETTSRELGGAGAKILVLIVPVSYDMVPLRRLSGANSWRG
jgi:hypothetical protein